MLLTVSRLGGAVTSGVAQAVALLTKAHRAHCGRLLGSFTIADDDTDVSQSVQGRRPT